MRRVGLLLLAGCASGCAGAEATTLPAASAPAARPIGTVEVGLTPGESMAFEVRIAGVLAGQAQLAVGELGDYEGHRAVVVKSRAETVGAAALLKHVVDESTTVIDMTSGRPLALDTLVEQGDSKTTGTARFTGHAAQITYARTGEAAPHKLVLEFGKAAVHDAHSAMAELRGWRATPGSKRSVFVVGGRRLWRVDVTYAGEDTIGSAIGNRRAIRFTAESYVTRPDLTAESARPSRTFSVWLSSDADRVPLRLTARTELGDIAMDLVEYNR
jgi:hypothetical protein